MNRWDYLIEKHGIKNVDAFRKGMNLFDWLQKQCLDCDIDNVPEFLRDVAIEVGGYQRHCLAAVATEIECNGASIDTAFDDLTSLWIGYCNASEADVVRLDSPEESGVAYDEYLRQNPLETFEDFMSRNPHIVPGSDEAYFASILCD